tara:strand:- start:1669 stop:1869 length:201 start_codon:yes stop_codon:yes gene_type:complete
LDAFYEFGIHPWDIAAALLIVEEAGGSVVDPSGAPLNLLSRRVLGGSKKLVQVIAETISGDHPKHP